MARPPEHQASSAAAADAPSDRALASAHLAGDATALRELMSRYDALVRYAIHRCSATAAGRDPQWTDAVASSVWTGFIESLARSSDNPPDSLRAYLLQIARNQAISAARASERRGRLTENCGLSVDDESPDPAAIVSEFEQIVAIRQCIGVLSPDDQRICDRLELIVDRRWTEAAAALGMAESTLRSRWGRILETLRACMRSKTGDDFAPGRAAGDS
ncbi:MAG: sigma-70 family RNA polymerase sigma factor [Phycisphaerales bacterium]|nr:MAG: sigma-70 family RNA polymerase sigma factor [Phycisphaerales bacterium]